MAQEFYTVEHAAQRLKLHAKTILRAIREGRLRAAKVGKSYRILRADLDAFAGVPAAAGGPAAEARATAIVDVPGVSPELASRLMSIVPATLNARPRGGAPVRADVTYDPELAQAKVVIVGPPDDVGALLRFLQVWLEG